jgi:hypothetical protein
MLIFFARTLVLPRLANHEFGKVAIADVLGGSL